MSQVGLWTKLGPGFSGFGLMYCGLSIEPGPTGSGLGPFQLYKALMHSDCAYAIDTYV